MKNIEKRVFFGVEHFFSKGDGCRACPSRDWHCGFEHCGTGSPARNAKHDSTADPTVGSKETQMHYICILYIIYIYI